jgi:hypothetical protein
MAKPKSMAVRRSFKAKYFRLVAAGLFFLLLVGSVAGFYSVQTMTASAAAADQLRVWAEPSDIIAAPGKPITVTLFATYENGYRLLRSSDVVMIPPEGVTVTPGEFHDQTPFSGSKTIGTATIIVNASGTFSIPLSASGKNIENASVVTMSTPISVVVR